MALSWRSALTATLVAPLGACIVLPIPRDIPLTGVHKGIVSDATTKKPLQGVQVSFVNHTEVSTVTNAEGEFSLAAVTQQSNWTGVLLVGPAESHCEDRVAFEKEGYERLVESKAVAYPGTGNCKGVSFVHSVGLKRCHLTTRC